MALLVQLVASFSSVHRPVLQVGLNQDLQAIIIHHNSKGLQHQQPLVKAASTMASLRQACHGRHKQQPVLMDLRLLLEHLLHTGPKRGLNSCKRSGIEVCDFPACSMLAIELDLQGFSLWVPPKSFMLTRREDQVRIRFSLNLVQE